MLLQSNETKWNGNRNGNVTRSVFTAVSLRTTGWVFSSNDQREWQLADYCRQRSGNVTKGEEKIGNWESGGGTWGAESKEPRTINEEQSGLELRNYAGTIRLRASQLRRDREPRTSLSVSKDIGV